MRAIRLLIPALALLVLVAPAHARIEEQPPFAEKVSIRSAPDGPFSATGNALCASGQAATTYLLVVGSSPDGLTLVAGKRFTCDDGSGTFDLVLHVRITFVPGGPPHPTTFRWLITEGTGRYESLQGAGTGVGLLANGELVDEYTGRVRSDG